MRIYKTIATFTVVALVLLLPSYLLAAYLQGRVVGISDGDTLTLLVDGNRQLKIRLS
jgi:micrococcal nuclease